MKKYLRDLYAKLLYQLHKPLVKPSNNDPFHLTFLEFYNRAIAHESPTMLKLGSRSVDNSPAVNVFPHCKEHIGMDIHPGVGVDVVGDAHKLSELFAKDQFDYIYSLSVFEHLFAPWKVVIEMNKVMKTGGYVFVGTHPVWPIHELPWDFWRFPENGFHALFNKHTGFEIVSLTEGLPAKLYSLVEDEPTKAACMHQLNQGVAVIARKVGDYRSDLLSWDIDISEILDTTYPNRNA